MVSKSRFLGGNRKLLFTPDGMVLTRCSQGRANECQDVNVRDPDCPTERLQDEFGVDIIISHLNTWQFLSSALKSEKYRDIIFRVNSPGAAWRSLVDIYSLKTQGASLTVDIIFRVNSPGAAWRSLVDIYSLKTQGASLTLPHKLDSVRIGTNDDSTLKLLEMEDITRSLRSSPSRGSISPHHTLSENS